MSTTIREAFAAVNLHPQGIVKWGTTPNEDAAGVYVVSLTEPLIKAPLAASKFEQWLHVCRQLTLDGTRPNRQQLMYRIRQFWIPDEVILYIGRAASLSHRVHQYYQTPIGARGPHSGGYFLKLLSKVYLDQLSVHYAKCPDPDLAEDRMLRRFCENVSPNSRKVLFDSERPFPFANLEWHKRREKKKVRKRHGIGVGRT